MGTGLLYGGAAAAIISLHLATDHTLGFHTDELYYLACGAHPALGYVDFPPLVPLLARLETALLGVSPAALRVLPSLLSGVLVAMTGLYVRRLGGTLGLQAIGLLIGITTPFFLAANWVFQTVTFDEVAWAVALYWFLCLVVDPRPRHWIYLGVTLGLGLEVKYVIIGLIAGMGLAVLVTPSLRAQLRTKFPWLGVAIALLIWLPNLAWQVANGFPTVVYVVNHGHDVAAGGGPLAYVVYIALGVNLLLPLWVAGLLSLFRNATLRPVGIVCAFPLVLFLFAGKAYYAAETIPLAMAQGIIVVSRVPRPRLRGSLEWATVVACLLGFTILFLFLVPVTPASRLHEEKLDAANEVFADSVGWPDVASQVSAIYEALPASERDHTVIVSAYYGVQGALRIYGDQSRLPVVVSPQLSDWYWLPKDVRATYALMVDYGPSDVGWMCTSAQLIAHLTVPYHVQGLEQGAPVTFCRLEDSLSKDWDRLRNFS